MPGPPINKNLWMGAWLVCQIVAAVLFGILTVQCMFYFDRFKQDKRGFKVLVSLPVHLSRECRSPQYGKHFPYNRPDKSHIETSDSATTFPDSLPRTLDFLIQIFSLCWITIVVSRHYGDMGYMGRSPWAIAPVCIVVFRDRYGRFNLSYDWNLIQSFRSFFYSTPLNTDRSRVTIPHEGVLNTWLKDFWFTAEAATDILVALIVVYSLRAGKFANSYNGKQGLRRLVVYTISNGLVTSVVAVVILVLESCSGSYPLTHTLVLIQLYSNSLLASLNLRGSWIKGQKPNYSEGIAPECHARFHNMAQPSPNSAAPNGLFSAMTLTDPDGLPMSNVEQRRVARDQTSGMPSHEPAATLSINAEDDGLFNSIIQEERPH
ncbi:hypothetical protein DL93DRAFT_2093579 [Clavulina sp. PMI_390]|nr:hypothetical protein DL93DRAFT_2093579 [Clavulina sp. PMI_390]